MTSPSSIFTAIVLAGDRGPNDPVATSTGVPCKALTPIGNRPMILRVLDALNEAQCIGSCLLSGPHHTHVEGTKELQNRVQSHQIKWTEPQSSPSASAHFVLQSIPHDQPILLTTADHALLTSNLVDHFCSEALKTKGDVVVGLVDRRVITKAYPDTKRTYITFGEMGYCGCNLFAFLTPQGRKAAQFWQQVERNRKKPWRLIGMLGWRPLLQYGLGQLSLDQALAQLSKRLEMKIQAVLLPYAEAAIDVDTVGDLALVKKIVEKQRLH